MPRRRQQGGGVLLFVLLCLVALARALLAEPRSTTGRPSEAGQAKARRSSVVRVRPLERGFRIRTRRPMAFGMTILLASGGLGLGFPAVQLMGPAAVTQEIRPRIETVAVGAGSEDEATGQPEMRPELPPPPSPEEVAVAVAHEQVGKPYRWAGAGPAAFDCSGLTSYVWRQAGVELPRTSRAQFAALPRVGLDELKPGDLVYSPGHIGLYIGDGRMIHAPGSGRRVEIAPVHHHPVVGAVRPAEVVRS